MNRVMMNDWLLFPDSMHTNTYTVLDMDIYNFQMVFKRGNFPTALFDTMKPIDCSVYIAENCIYTGAIYFTISHTNDSKVMFTGTGYNAN